jgi:CheY-like chemotaxis protein
MKTILIADDDSTVLKLFHLDVESRDLDVSIRSSATGEDTIIAVEAMKPDVIVLDIRMPKGDGFAVLEHLKKQNIDIPVVILTNYRNNDSLEKSKTYAQVKEYMVKHEVRMERVIDAVSAHIA